MMAAGSSTINPVRIVPLGGLGEIGLNLMAVECAGRAVVIDCGVMFPEEPLLGTGLFVPGFEWFDSAKVTFDAIFLTHAH
jgi:ribonuclease J